MKANIHTSGKGNIMIFLLLAFVLCIGQSHTQSNAKQDNLLKRTLIVTFKPQASADSIQAVDNAVIELSKIAQVKSFEWGIENIKDETKRHVYIFGYAKEEDIPLYEKSRQHDDLVKAATPVVQSVEMIDYWKKN